MVPIAEVLVQGFGLTWSAHICRFPAVPGRSCRVPQAGRGSWTLAPDAQVMSREMQKSLPFRWSEPLWAVLRLTL